MSFPKPPASGLYPAVPSPAAQRLRRPSPVDRLNREHLVLLRPGRHGLLLHTLYYQDEVRAEEEFHTESAALPARRRGIL